MSQKLWAKLIKGPEVRFISHLDLLGAFEKALRRARLPVAMTQGYNPRPKIAFAAALPVGITSRGEYVEFVLRETREPLAVLGALNEELPRGLHIDAIKAVDLNTPALMAMVNLAVYRVCFVLPPFLDEDRFRQEWPAFLNQDRVIITRVVKKRTRTFDFLPFLKGQEVLEINQGRVVVELAITVGSKGSVRPGEIVAAFWEYCRGQGQLYAIEREGLYIVGDGGDLSTPLEWVG